MQINPTSYLPSNIMDTTYNGRTFSELVVLVGTVVSALLTVLNHYHHNTGHRNYCLAVTITGLAIYFNLRNLYLLGTQNERMEKNLDRFNAENEKYASLNTKLHDEVNGLSNEISKLDKTIGEKATQLETAQKLIGKNHEKVINEYITQVAALAKNNAELAKSNAEHEKLLNLQRWKNDATRILEILVSQNNATENDKVILNRLKDLPDDFNKALDESFGTGSQFAYVPPEVTKDVFGQTNGDKRKPVIVGA